MNRAWMSTRRTFLAASIALPLTGWAKDVEPPPLMLAKVFNVEEDLDLADFCVSEKLDGVRAFWTGTQLLTRAGHPIAAPSWFVDALPHVPLDGELWGGRRTFDATSGTVRSAIADEAAWRRLRYMVFDAPAAGGDFELRSTQLQHILAATNVQWLQAIAQRRFDRSTTLAEELQRIEALGGEGLMLHRATSLYRPGRSDDLLKVKSAFDAEARVIGYEPGKGKYAGLVGALIVEGDDGKRFKVGSGLSDTERRKPPVIGAWVTYAYNGATSSGLPRFPRFVRVREE